MDSSMKKIPRYLFIFFSAFLLLLAAMAILAKVFFPSEKIRVMAEKRLGEALKDQASIGSLSLSFTKGFEARDITIGGEKGPLKIQGIYFFYDLYELLNGRVVVTRMGVDRPAFSLERSDGRWNFERYPDLAQAEKTEESPPATGGIVLPSLPLPIDLQSFIISDLSVRARDEANSFQWDGLDLVADLGLSGQNIHLNLELRDDVKNGLASTFEALLNPASGQSPAPSALTATPVIQLRLSGNSLEDLALTGNIKLQNLLFKSGEERISAPAVLSLDMKLNLQKGEVAINHFSMDLLDRNLIDLTGGVSDLFTLPSVRLNVSKAFLNLDSLSPFIEAVLPAFSASGEIKIDSLDMMAKVDENAEAKGSAKGKVLIQSVSLEEKALGMALENLSGWIDLGKAEFGPSRSLSAALSVDMGLKGGRYGGIVIEKAACGLDSFSLMFSDGSFSSLTGVLEVGLESLTAEGVKLEDMKNRIDFRVTGKDQAEIDISHATKGINAVLPDGAKVFSSASLQVHVGMSGENLSKVELQGNMALPDLNVKSENFSDTIPIYMEPTASLDLAEKKFSLTSLKIKLLDKNTLNITGTASLAQAVDLGLEANGALALEEIMPLVSGFFPQLHAKGKVELKKMGIHLQGDSGFQNYTARAHGGVDFKNLTASYDSNSIRGLDGEAGWEVEGITNQGIKGATGGIHAQADFAGAKAQDAEIRKGEINLQAKAMGGGNLHVDFGFDAAEVSYPISEKEKISLPFLAQGKAAGNIDELNFKIESLRWEAGKVLHGELKAEAKKSGEEGLELEHALFVDFGKIMKVPGIRNLSPALLDLNLGGILNNQTTIRGSMVAGKPEKMAVDSMSTLSKASFSHKGLSSLSEPWKTPPFDASLAFQAKSGAGRHKLEKLLCSVKDFMDVSASGEFGGDGKSFTANLAVQKFDLAKLVESVPPIFLESFPGLKASGDIQFLLGASGRLPAPGDWEQFPGEPLPLSVEAGLKIKGVGLQIPGQEIEVSGVEGPVDLQYGKNGLCLSSGVHLRKIRYPKIASNPFSVESVMELQWDAPGRLLINKFNATIPELGISQYLKVEITGLSPFLRDGLAPNLPNLLNGLHCEVDGGVSLQLPESKASMEGAKAKGQAGLNFLFNLQPKKEISLEGKVDFKEFGVEYGDSAVLRGLDGGLPFKKKFVTVAAKEKQGSAHREKTDKLAGARALSFLHYQPKKKRIAIESLALGGQEIFQVELEPSFDGDAYSLDRFAFKALGGYVVGNLSLAKGPDKNGISIGLEFAGIDSNRLLSGTTDKKSSINGHIALSIPLPGGAGSEELDIGNVDLDVNITKIGEEVLDRLLLFFDPKESNPGIVDLRSKLKLAVPTKALLRLKNGALSISTQLKLLAMGGGLMDVHALERVPIARLSGLGKVNELLVGAKNLSPYLNLLFAEELRIGDNGEVWLGEMKLAGPDETQ
jgi:hypothetical protein